MSQELLNELISKSEELNIEKKLQLMRYLSSHLQRNDNSTPKPRRKWRDIQGKATYPLVGEDAQEWVSRTRQEATENREQIIRNNYES
ncbi:MAG: hypothetical protein F6K25_10280 [Okeania sp. SIO2G4]|uniref:hypothetical protein n=1 Tax=unclassified Okeania TaxID=2634635 RepID=UPI0013B8400A|nr:MULTISPECIES: hypothetical protein [unclassified Okeania]NEP03794.1 hypothetical protein [Okeania sp. SIO4D6]NEP72094.1 hypothetical protein [Okeania sp. SIO2G5]NEP92952.1 hypothetical protein [Okeania sp. SIO2F5]NEQ91072.1 hypothetical protein [Okeania sp. SIO2G4]